MKIIVVTQNNFTRGADGVLILNNSIIKFKFLS
jgi:hypothetical protein